MKPPAEQRQISCWCSMFETKDTWARNLFLKDEKGKGRAAWRRIEARFEHRNSDSPQPQRQQTSHSYYSRHNFLIHPPKDKRFESKMNGSVRYLLIFTSRCTITLPTVEACCCLNLGVQPALWLETKASLQLWSESSLQSPRCNQQVCVRPRKWNKMCSLREKSK